MCKCLSLHFYEKGHVVFRRGDAGRRVFIVVDGIAGVYADAQEFKPSKRGKHVRQKQKQQQYELGKTPAQIKLEQKLKGNDDGATYTPTSVNEGTFGQDIYQNNAENGSVSSPSPETSPESSPPQTAIKAVVYRDAEQRYKALGVCLARRARGHSFGELAVMRNVARAATVVAEEALIMFSLDGDDWMKLLMEPFDFERRRKLDALCRCAAFRHYGLPKLHAVADYLSPHEFAFQQPLIRQGERPTHVHIITRGVAEMIKTYNDPLDIADAAAHHRLAHGNEHAPLAGTDAWQTPAPSRPGVPADLAVTPSPAAARESPLARAIKLMNVAPRSGQWRLKLGVVRQGDVVGQHACIRKSMQWCDVVAKDMDGCSTYAFYFLDFFDRLGADVRFDLDRDAVDGPIEDLINDALQRMEQWILTKRVVVEGSLAVKPPRGRTVSRTSDIFDRNRNDVRLYGPPARTIETAARPIPNKTLVPPQVKVHGGAKTPWRRAQGWNMNPHARSQSTSPGPVRRGGGGGSFGEKWTLPSPSPAPSAAASSEKSKSPSSRKKKQPRALSRLERAELVQFDAEAEHWEFAHAITRDVAYNTLLKAQVRPIHARMATALEGSLGESSRYEAVVLSHHWEQAGEPERAVVYLDLAAFHALEQGAFAETVRFLDRATRLDVPSVTAAQRGRWERALAEASFSLGDIGGAEGHARRALALLGRPLPDGQAGLVGIALRQLGRHVLGLLWRPSPETTEEGRALATLCSQSAQIVTQCAYYADAKLPLLVGGLVTLNLAEAAGHGAQLSRALGAAGIVSSSVGWGPLAKRYLARARSIAEDLDDRGALAWALFCDAMAHAAMAEWDRVADSGSRAMEVSEQLDDRQTLHHALTTLALADYFHGDLRSAETRFRRLHELATETVQTQHEAWGLYGMAECMLVRGQVEAALPRLVQAQDILATQSQRDLPSEIICSALLARAWDQLGDGDRALVAAREALSLAATSEPNAFGALEGYAVPFELLMRRWDEARRSGHPGLAARWAELETARTAMERFARQHPLGRPRHQLLLGDLAALQGDRRKASRLWARACSKARALQMRVEEGRALTRMALAVGPDDKRRARWAQAAHALFVACDARVPLRRMGVLIALTTATPALPEGAGGPGRSAGGRGA